MFHDEVQNIKKQFPIFQSNALKNLVYLDNAASTQKPLSVIEAINRYNATQHANIHRGAYALSVGATEIYEKVRHQVKEFIGASRDEEIVYTKGTTDGLNLLASAYGMMAIEAGDEIVISRTEHHSNILPWQQVARAKGGVLKYLDINSYGELLEGTIEEQITPRTKIVSIGAVSNALGVIHPIKKIIDYAHQMGAIVIIDGAQSVPHMPIDVQALDIDFLVFSGHKMMGPTGIGILYGKYELLNEMPPYQTGGDMIEYVEEQEATYAPVPTKFEAGTPNIEGVVGLGAAIEFIASIGIEKIRAHEKALTKYAFEVLEQVPYIKIYGPPKDRDRGSVISFNIEGVHPHDVASIVDVDGVAIRAGHHCAQPLMKYLNIKATCRASFYLYNDEKDIDALANSLKKVRGWLGYGS